MVARRPRSGATELVGVDARTRTGDNGNVVHRCVGLEVTNRPVGQAAEHTVGFVDTVEAQFYQVALQSLHQVVAARTATQIHILVAIGHDAIPSVSEYARPGCGVVPRPEEDYFQAAQ